MERVACNSCRWKAADQSKDWGIRRSRNFNNKLPRKHVIFFCFILRCITDTSFNLKFNIAFGTLIISREGKTFPLVPEAGYTDWGFSPFSSFALRIPRIVPSSNNVTLDAGLLARSQYSEGPATGYLDTGFSWFPCVYKQMLRWFTRFQVATTCFSCSPSDLNFLDPYFIFMYIHNNHCHRATANLQLNILLLL